MGVTTMRISDSIEQFIKTLLQQEEREIELKRNELAEYFGCAPSQINYVLSTRFTPNHGYIIESRRGGGGFIRIVRAVEEDDQGMMHFINHQIGERLSEGDAAHLVTHLVEREAVSAAEGELLRSATCSGVMNVPVPEGIKDTLRARVMKSMILTIIRLRNNQDHSAE